MYCALKVRQKKMQNRTAKNNMEIRLKITMSLIAGKA
jgi:hypothetical protein